MKVIANWDVTTVEQELIDTMWPSDAEIIYTRKTSARAQGEELDNARVIVGGANPELLNRAPKVELVQMLGHGIDGVLKHRDLLLQRGIKVARANPASINISEFVMMAMIALSRRVLKMHEALAYLGSWSPERKAHRMEGALGGELSGSTLGLIGYGSISREILRKAKAFDMQVGVLVRHPERIDLKQEGIDFAEPAGRIDQFLSRCRYVVLSLPLTDESRGLFNRERFSAMMPGSFLVNISRGPIVDEAALFEALQSGTIAGAALDVWIAEEAGRSNEYPSPYPLHQYNVLMTPHYCGATRESRERAIAVAGDNIRRLMASQPLLNIADLNVGY